MRFLERSKTQHIKSGREWPAGQEWPTRQDSTRRDIAIRKEHSRQDSFTARPSTSSMTSTQLKRRSSLPLGADGTRLQAGPRIRLRPTTAEGDDKARVSFFEAFKIDAGEDFFAFPKPSSGKTPPISDVEFASPVASPAPQSPLIGIAIGSPSHPTTEWTTLMPASAKSSIISPRILAVQQSPFLNPSPLQTSFDAQTPQDSSDLPTPETAERKKSSWKNIFRRPSKPVKSHSSPVTTTPTVASPDSSTAIHNKPQRLRASSRAMERIDLEARLSASSSPPAKKHTFAPTNPLALNPPTPKFANAPAFPASPLPAQPSLNEVQSAETARMTIDIAGNATPARQSSKAPLPPSKQPSTMNANRPINNRPAMATGLAVPRLNLTLPSYQMERYSVMFEGVLDAKPTSAPPAIQKYPSPISKSPTASPIQTSPQSALLERRRSRLRMLDVPSSHRPVPLQDQTQLSAITPVKSAALPVRQLKSEAFLPRHPSVRSDHTIPARSESTNRARVFHKPLPLQRSKTSPLPKKSPIRTYFQNVGKRQDPISRQIETFFDSPVSADDEDMSFPDTPPPLSTSPAMIPDVHVVTDYSLPSVTTESSDKDNLSTVWHSVLPTAPASSTSSRFSVDIHRAMESPDTPLSRSKSIDTTATRAFIHKVQVATARRINMSRAQNDAIESAGLSKQPLRPMLVNVNGSHAHSRETSMQDIGSAISA